ncbi:MAG TPA: histidine kinase [Streptosporangiaceae bacterium]|jgi:signal transduction histidine kinase
MPHEQAREQARDQSWVRWKAAWQHAFFATVLALVVLGALAGQDHSAIAVMLRIGPAVTLAAWYAYWVGWRGGTPPLAYLIGAAVVWAVMTAVDPALLPAGLAVLAPYCLRRALWSAGGVIIIGAVWLWQRATYGSVDVRAFLGCALGMAAAVIIAGYIATLDHESRKRQRLLDELTAAQAELAAAERRAGTLAERGRLARDIHDTLTQGFASIAMLLDAARDDLPPGSPAARRVDQAMRTARDNLAESRRLINALRPAQLDGTHLTDAVRELTTHLADEAGIQARTVVTGKPIALAPATEGELLRVVQEALTNVRRHAGATDVTVTFTYLDAVLAIDIADDGVGFDPAARPAAGVGLAAMRERVNALGGSLTVESLPGEGTTIAVSTPLTAPTAHARTDNAGSADDADDDEMLTRK